MNVIHFEVKLRALKLFNRFIVWCLGIKIDAFITSKVLSS